VVGRPLAALLANDGAKVYSVDISNTQIFHRGKSLSKPFHTVTECTETLEHILSISDVVITGVPVESYRVPVEHLKDGAVAINFATCMNFDKDEVKNIAGVVSLHRIFKPF
jgi:methylenetetrahydrofolate dehydrogenase (NAD+)